MTTVQSASAASVHSASTSSSQTYTIERGDTLSAIAEQHGTSVSALMNANPGIHDANRIYPGDKLHIPAHASNGGDAKPKAGDSQGGDAKPKLSGGSDHTASAKPGHLQTLACMRQRGQPNAAASMSSRVCAPLRIAAACICVRGRMRAK